MQTGGRELTVSSQEGAGEVVFVELSGPVPAAKPKSLAKKAANSDGSETIANRKSLEISTSREISESIDNHHSFESVDSSEAGKLIDGAGLSREEILGEVGVEGGPVASAKARYLHALKLALESRKIYPRIARQMREEGSVVLRIQISEDGHIQPINIVKPSAHERLNVAALGLISSLEKFLPLPNELAENSLTIDVPIEYSLN